MNGQEIKTINSNWARNPRMTDKAVQYYLDKNKLIDIRVDLWSDSNMFVSIYNDRNDSCVGYTCSREELKGLADFLYKTIGEKK